MHCSDATGHSASTRGVAKHGLKAPEEGGNLYPLCRIMELPIDERIPEEIRPTWSKKRIRSVVEFKASMGFTILRSKQFWEECLTGYNWQTVFDAFMAYTSSQSQKLVDNIVILSKSWGDMSIGNMLLACKVRINKLLTAFAVDDDKGLLASVSEVVKPLPNILLYSGFDSFKCGEIILNGNKYYKDFNSTTRPLDLIAPRGIPAPEGMVSYYHITKQGGTVLPHDRYSKIDSKTVIRGLAMPIPGWLAPPVIAVLTRKSLSQRFLYPPSLIAIIPQHLKWVIGIVSSAVRGSMISASTTDELKMVSMRFPKNLVVRDNRYVVSESTYIRLSVEMTVGELDEFFTQQESI